MNQTFKDFFDAVEYILLRLLLLGLLGIGAWALLGRAELVRQHLLIVLMDKENYFGGSYV